MWGGGRCGGRCGVGDRCGEGVDVTDIRPKQHSASFL